MERLKYIFVWLSRIAYCRGFGIQSPTDYWFVRYVINEHWPYYEYDAIGQGDDWLRKKLGRFYFRVANFRQPEAIETDDYQDYFHAGCRNAAFRESGELIRISLNSDNLHRIPQLLNKVTDNSILILEGIRGYRELWREVQDDERVRVTFDLFYCGVALFDKKRHKQNYMINF